MSRLILKKINASDVPTPSANTVTLFIDITSGKLTAKDETGIVVDVGDNYANLVFWWNNAMEQAADLPIAEEGERGMRLDEIGRKVYEKQSGLWVYVFDMDGGASLIPFTDAGYPALTNVGQTLLLLMDIDLVVELSGGSINEVGLTVDDVSFSWTLSRDVTSQILDNGIGSIPPGTTIYDLIAAGITGNTTFTITVADEIDESQSSTSVLFKHPVYYGIGGETIDNAGVLALSGYELRDDREAEFDVIGGGYYIYFAMPASYAPEPTFFVNGILNTAWEKTTIVGFENASGYIEPYYIYRSTYLQNASDNIHIKIA